MIQKVQAETSKPTSIDALPIDVLCKIGQELAPKPKLQAWHDGATAAAAAASCVIASKTSQHIGMAAYRALLRPKGIDASVIPDMVTRNSTVKQLQAALAKWQLVRTGNKADLWARIEQAHSPLCPVPRNMRQQVSELRSRAPVKEYLLCRDDDVPRRGMSKIVDVHAESLKRFGSLHEWTLAFAERVKENRFFVVHCQPYYDDEVRRYVDEWDDDQDSYYNSGGGGGDYWRQRERYRDGYDDSDDERASVTKEAREIVKPEAMRKWVAAFQGGPRCAIASPYLPDSFRQQLCMSLAKDELDSWIDENVLSMFDDILHVKKKEEIVAFARKLFFTREITCLNELDTAVTPERFDTLYVKISAWSNRVHEAHMHVSSKLSKLSKLKESPTMIDLYPSLAKLLAASDRDTIHMDFEKLVESKQTLAKMRLQVVRDIKRGKCSRCAMCPESHRIFDGHGLRSHAQNKHRLISNEIDFD